MGCLLVAEEGNFHGQYVKFMAINSEFKWVDAFISNHKHSHLFACFNLKVYFDVFCYIIPTYI